MAKIKEPQSMDELVYFTNRGLGTGWCKVWVYRKECPKCKKGMMGKPLDEKTGHVKIRASEYICSSCSYSIPKTDYEDTLTAEAMYSCPHCKKEGDWTGPFKRKTIDGVKTIRVTCTHCGGFMDITKKMAEKKKKKSKDVEDLADDDF